MFRSHWIEWFDPIRIEIPFGYSNSTTLSFIHSISITHLMYNIGIFHNDKSIISIRSFFFHFNIPDFITISILIKLSYIVSFTQTINCQQTHIPLHRSFIVYSLWIVLILLYNLKHMNLHFSIDSTNQSINPIVIRWEDTHLEMRWYSIYKQNWLSSRRTSCQHPLELMEHWKSLWFDILWNNRDPLWVHGVSVDLQLHIHFVPTSQL